MEEPAAVEEVVPVDGEEVAAEVTEPVVDEVVADEPVAIDPEYVIGNLTWEQLAEL